MFTPSDHTFVICAYKDNPFLQDTIDSLKAQTALGNIILSTSTPSSYLEGICERNEIEMTVNPNPRSAGRDWNWGYDHAQTSLVTMAHQDDIYLPEYVEFFLERMNRYEAGDVSIAFSDYSELREGEVVTDNAILKVKRVMNWPFSHDLFNGSKFVQRRILAFGDSICCPAVMLNKTVVGNSPFDEEYINSCDYKTWIDLSSKPGRFVYINKPLLMHRIYAESATTRNLESNVRQVEDTEILSKLWPGPIGRVVYSVLSKSEKSNEL